ncbi:MAG: four helix bundle protein [Cytophagales bacterium]
MPQKIKEKSFDFALNSLKTFKKLQSNKEYIISKQFLRSSTSIGALIRESEFAESKKDFIHKLAIALKEANETIYWLDLLKCADYLEKCQYTELKSQNKQIIYMLIAIIKSSKKNMVKASK